MSHAPGATARAAARLLVPWLMLGAAAACHRADAGQDEAPDPAELARRSGQFDKALAAPDSGGGHGGAIARWLLPDVLQEISGLALTSDGRLLAHGDKRGLIYEIDFRRGAIVKEFSIGDGKRAVKGDFEGITVANGSIFLLTSDSKLYEFKEGADRSEVPYTLHEPGLDAQCEFEGVAFDPSINSLLLACKKVHEKALKDSLVIYRWKLDGDDDSRLSRLTVPRARAIGANGWDGLHPSDITVEPRHGNYVLVASRERAILEITPAGAVVFSRPLPPEHLQAEGIAITKDSLLLISDEAGKIESDAGKALADAAKHPNRVADDSVHRRASIAVYRWP